MTMRRTPTRSPRRPVWLIRFLGLCALSLGGCAGTPPPVFYTLDAPTPAGLTPAGLTPAAPAAQSPSIVVLPAEIPEGIDRPQLVTREDGNRVVIHERYRWAAPLRGEIARVVADELGRRLGTNRVLALPYAPEDPSPDYRLSLAVQRLDAWPGRGVSLDAQWQIKARDGTVQSGRAAFEEAVEATGEAAHAALAAAQGRALRRLADDIARTLRR